jgi:hypothetical protein
MDPQDFRIDYEEDEFGTALFELCQYLGEKLQDYKIFRLRVFDPIYRRHIYQLRATPRALADSFKDRIQGGTVLNEVRCAGLQSLN